MGDDIPHVVGVEPWDLRESFLGFSRYHVRRFTHIHDDRWSYSEWTEQVDRVKCRERKALKQGTPNDWIEETVVLAADIYENSTTGKNLSYDYVAQYAPIIERQFLKGGLRLAALLEEIY